MEAPRFAPSTAKAATPPVDGVRAFVFLSGLRWLRERGHDAAFFELLPPDLRNKVKTTTATEWVSLDEALTCYRACDELGLSTEDQIDLGRTVSSLNNGVVVNTLVRLAGGLGATPWFGLRHVDKVWQRSNRGGAVAVFEEAPQAARLEFWRVPLASSRFFVTSMRGAIAFGIEPFCSRLVVSDIPDKARPDEFALRLTWL